MATQNRPVIGYIHCDDCGERGTVHQSARGKGRYLYKRCGCGCDQRTGKAVQTRLYFGMDRVVPDEEIKRPMNVPEQQPDNLDKSTVPAVSDEPEEQPNEPESTETPQPENEPKGNGLAAFAVMGVGVGFLLKFMAGSL